MSELGEKIIAEVRRLVAEKPEYVYQQPFGMCVYVSGGCGSCLIGQALFNLGLIDASLERTIHNGATAFGLIEHLGLDIENTELVWLRNVQFAQDSHAPWGEAVNHADDEVSRDAA